MQSLLKGLRMNILYSEQSQRTRSAELLVVVFVILLVGAMVLPPIEVLRRAIYYFQNIS